MPGISKDDDTAVGDLVPSQSKVFSDGLRVIVDNDSVVPHTPFVQPHITATMIAQTTKVFIGGIPVVKAGDSATCGDIATGSSKVFVEG